MTDCLYNKGSNVIYGSNGVCLIEDIKKISFSDKIKAQEYYILRPVNSPSSVVYVPVNNDNLTSKMRPALTKAEIDDILMDSRDKKIDWIEDKNDRNARFHDILASGAHQNLILMIKCICDEKKILEANKRKLPITDEMDLKTAEKFIEEEFGYSLKMPEDTVVTYIKDKLGICEA